MKTLLVWIEAILVHIRYWGKFYKENKYAIMALVEDLNLTFWRTLSELRKLRKSWKLIHRNK